jgi:hypothetical protein
MAQIALKLVMKLATETFIAKMVVLGARELAKLTSNQMDDKMVQAIEEALGVKV